LLIFYQSGAGLEELFREEDFEDDDEDEEVEDFARRLNSDWQDRMQVCD
jgi:hypothetical protein